MTKITKKQEALFTELLKDFDGDAEDLLGRHGLVMELKKRGLEAMLEGELTDHLGYEPSPPSGNGTGNSRNGRGSKKVQSKDGPMELEVPRDRNGSFEPQVVKKRQRRLDGLDDMIIALYARGHSTRGIQDELLELYGAEVSPTLISNVTNSVLEEVQAWQARPLDPVYPIVYFDCLFVKSRQDGAIRNKAVYLALAINMDGIQSGTGSLGTGAATMTYDDVSGLFSWNIAWGGLQGTETVMHFHGPAGPGTNAGVQLDFGSISGTTSPSIGATPLSTSQGNDLLADLWYINIHSTVFPGGEIRGQVEVIPIPAAAWLFGSALVGLVAVKRKKA